MSKEKLISRKKAQKLYDAGYAVDGKARQNPYKGEWQRCASCNPSMEDYWCDTFRVARADLPVVNRTCGYENYYMSEKQRWKEARKNKDISFTLKNPQKYGKFVYIGERCSISYSTGDVVTLECYGNSSCPEFKSVKTGQTEYIGWFELKPYKEPKHKCELPTDNIKMRICSKEQSEEVQRLLFTHTDTCWHSRDKKIRDYDVTHFYVRNSLLGYTSSKSEDYHCSQHDLQEVCASELIAQLKKLDKPEQKRTSKVKVQVTPTELCKIGDLLYRKKGIAASICLNKQYLYIGDLAIRQDTDCCEFLQHHFIEVTAKELIKRLEQLPNVKCKG